ncbi:hypothetical protein [Streptomyces flavofungini]|nr:hypothetical protein [Streptomyces flavofungini]WJV50036.1 hypothetical protein QUY26_33660 [Streptomyces flavofungini]
MTAEVEVEAEAEKAEPEPADTGTVRPPDSGSAADDPGYGRHLDRDGFG